MPTRQEWTRQRRIAARYTEALRARGARSTRGGLEGQLLDGQLLRLSALYRRSRSKFLKLGGSFRPELLSSPRTLSSPELVSLEIPYTPSASELLWSMTDPRESRTPSHFERIRAYSTSLFHEQNHRILWCSLLPPPPPPSVRNPVLTLYFNLAESLVVMLDQALGDELGPELSGFLYRSGVTYDPGTDWRSQVGSRREYRNLLHAGMYATYLALGGMPARDIRRIVPYLYPDLPRPARGRQRSWIERAVERSLRLDRRFIQLTNPDWQRRHGAAARREIARLRGGRTARGDELPSRDPLDHRWVYLSAERTLEAFSI